MVLQSNDVSLPISGTISNTEPGNGLLSIKDNGTPDNPLDDLVIYTPNSSFSGIDSFEYTICDASQLDNCDTAVVSITVEPKEEDIATELKPFPSGYGAGAKSTVIGGRGGIVVHVTNLNDSGVGSFREALQMTVPRIIVFDVSGVINLTSLLGMGSANSYVTVAGQTAPEGGITIDGHRLYLGEVDQVIFRYIRFRGGNTAAGFGYTENDSFTVSGGTNQIYDHCSFSFDGDETGDWAVSSGTATIANITVQRCMFGEGTKGALFGGMYDATTGELSFHHNLFYNITHRTPNVTGFNGSSSKIETINNVAWTIENRLIQSSGNMNWNHINNYYDYGYRPINDGRLHMQHSIDATPPQIYTNGNKIVAVNSDTQNGFDYTVAQINANNKLGHKYFQNAEGHLIGDELPASYFTDTQHPLLGYPIPIQSADEAFASVKADVGCNARLNADGTVSDNTDVVDFAQLTNVRNGVYVTRNKNNWVIPNITPIYRPAGYDTDNDGMPNIWETANGLDPNANDSAEDNDGDGYTNLEEFLNQVDK
jgi:hypothetical protein